MSSLEAATTSATARALDQRPRRGDTWVFLREFIRAPLRTASVVPSSQALAARMVQPLQRREQGSPVVVELGPGTGSFTAALHEASPDLRYVGIELNPTMADHLTARFPGTELIAAIAAGLAPSGAYTQFTYSWSRWAPPGRRQHRELQRFFGHVALSPTVWRNLPPAVVYTSTAPRRTDAAAPGLR